MTDNQKYEVLLKKLAESLQEKNDTISLQKWKISDLESKLKESIAEIEKMKGEARK